MRGRKPKPTHLKLVEGNPGKRPLNENEPKGDPVIPRCPAHLPKGVKKIWPKLAKLLHSAKLLTNLDVMAFQMLCEAWARWEDACAEVQKLGPVVKTKNGFPVQNPYLQVANKAYEQLQKMLVEFGLTPSSRSRVTVTDPDDPDPTATNLFGGK